MQDIKISIITPVYNRETEIERCLNSVLRQDYENYEHIVINDGSSDRTASVVNEYKKLNRRIKLVDYQINRGVNYARNRGIDSATGLFVLFLDSDDQLNSNSLSKVADCVRENPGYDHFLFLTPDKRDSRTDLSNIREVFFRDWISGAFAGDFTLVIKRDYLLEFPFLEQFRAFEGLSLLRICRVSEPQLFYPLVIVDIDRSRDDSLTKIINSKNELYYTEHLKKNLYYIDNFIEDHLLYGDLKKMRKTIIKTIIYASVLNRSHEAKRMISLLRKHNQSKWYYGLLMSRFCRNIFIGLMNNDYL